MSQEPQVKYIERIQISNFWGMYDVDWTLDKDVNILIGGNGSGKTTLLELIYEYVEFTKILKNKDSIKSFSEENNIQFFEAKFALFQNLTYKYKGLVTLSFNDSIRVFRTDENNTNTIIVFDNHGNLIKNQNIPLQLIKTFDALLVDRDSYEKKKKPEIRTPLDYEIDDLIDDYVEYQLNLFKKAKNGNGNIKDISARYDLFIEILNNLFSETNKTVNKEANRIEFILNGKETIKPTKLSSGEKQVLIILLTVLLQDGQHHILMLDEPEVSLHIGWQQKLIRLIRQLNPNCQLIVATHSPSMFGDKAEYPIYRMENILKIREAAEV